MKSVILFLVFFLHTAITVEEICLILILLSLWVVTFTRTVFGYDVKTIRLFFYQHVSVESLRVFWCYILCAGGNTQLKQFLSGKVCRRVENTGGVLGCGVFYEGVGV